MFPLILKVKALWPIEFFFYFNVFLFENVRFNKSFHDWIKIFDLERKQSKLNQINQRYTVKKINMNHYPLIAVTYYKGTQSCCSSSCSKKGITFCFICQAYLLVKKVQWFTVEPSLGQVFLRFVNILFPITKKKGKEIKIRQVGGYLL